MKEHGSAHRGQAAHDVGGTRSGWTSAWTLAVTETISFGALVFSFSVLLIPMEAELGLSQTELTTIFGLAVATRALAVPATGAWIDRLGGKSLMAMGSAFGALVLVAWSFAYSQLQLVTIFVALGIVTAAVLYEPAFAVVSRWFTGRDQARAILLISTVSAFASTVFVPFTAVLVDAFGWRDALRVLAGIVVVGTLVPHLFLLRDPVSERLPVLDRDPRWRPPQGMRVAEAMRDVRFRWFVIGSLLGVMPIMAVWVHLPSILMSRGLVPTMAATISGGLGLAMVAGRLFLARAGVRHSYPGLLAVILFVQAAALFALALVPGFWVSVGFVAFFGLGAGTISFAKPIMIAEWYGGRSYGAIAGVIGTVVILSQSVSPALVSAGRSWFGNYDGVLVLLGGAELLSMLCFIRLAVVARRIPAHSSS